MKPLSGLKVANFTTRLPGPLGCQLLSDLGAKVVKWECRENPDAFIDSELAQKVAEFPRWYHRLNKRARVRNYLNKNLIDKNWVKKNLSPFQALLVPVSRSTEVKKMMAIWRKLPGARVSLEIGGKRDGGPMQDLIALARAGVIKPEKKKPPKLPVIPMAGVLFGHQIALELLALWIQALKSGKSPGVRRIFLEGICEKNLDFMALSPMSSSLIRTLPLHQGGTPCYNLYLLKDGDLLVLACIEEKHYLEVEKTLDLPVCAKERLSREKKQIEKMRVFFRKIKAEEIVKKISPKTPGIFIIQNKQTMAQR